jgi:hypothetical protein
MKISRRSVGAAVAYRKGGKVFGNVKECATSPDATGLALERGVARTERLKEI